MRRDRQARLALKTQNLPFKESSCPAPTRLGERGAVCKTHELHARPGLEPPGRASDPPRQRALHYFGQTVLRKGGVEIRPLFRPQHRQEPFPSHRDPLRNCLYIFSDHTPQCRGLSRGKASVYQSRYGDHATRSPPLPRLLRGHQSASLQAPSVKPLPSER